MLQPKATLKFPLGEVTLEEKEEEEANKILSVDGIVKAQLLNGLCTAHYVHDDLKLRYSFKVHACRLIIIIFFTCKTCLDLLCWYAVQKTAAFHNHILFLLVVLSILWFPLCGNCCWQFLNLLQDEEMSFIPSISLPSNALSFAFKRRFGPSDKLRLVISSVFLSSL